MFDLNNSDLIMFSDMVEKQYKKGTTAPLLLSEYCRNALGKEFAKLPEDKHKVINIPKPLYELMKGDMEPAYQIVIDGYPIIDGIPYWFKESTYNVDIAFGYKNGDSRFPSDISFNDNDKHMLLAGISGMGKSVALNDIITYMCKAYAPWELTLTLADAKVIEFKSYASGGILPHIESIAATQDTDYIISILEHKQKEMMKVNSAFTASRTGAKNIMQFREATGLCLPRNIIIIDECQALFSNAGRKGASVEKLFDSFARLGRNTGYHLLLASQGLSGDLNKDLIAQFNIRACLGATADVSNKILGNEASAMITQKGKMNVNLYPTKQPNEMYNIEYRVPFQPPNEFNNDKLTLERLGKEFKFKKDLNFYDEEQVIEELDYPNFLRKCPLNPNKIFLGEPSFYMDGELKVFCLEFRVKDGENITIVNHQKHHQERYVKMLRDNILAHPDITNIVLYNDEDDYYEWKMNLLPGIGSNFRESSNPYYRSCLNLVQIRKIMVDVDAKVFLQNLTSESGDRAFYKAIESDPTLNNETNRSRAHYIIKELQNSELSKHFGLSAIGIKPEEKQGIENNIVFQTLTYYKRYGYNEKQITRKVMPVQYVWILGLDRVFGIGTDVRGVYQDELKKACQNSSLYNIRFIIVTKTVNDMSFLKQVGNYYILDSNKPKDISGVGASDVYPNDLGKTLGVLYDAGSDEVYKFKKIALQGENLLV